MKPHLLFVALSLTFALLAPVPRAAALSIALPSPEINFPKPSAPAWAPEVLRALRAPQTHYLGGLISEWPPAWATILDYDGDTDALNSLLASLTSAPGLRVACSFVRSTAPNAQPGSWRVEYAQTAPNRLTVTINLRSQKIDLTQLHLPEYQNPPAPR